MQSSSTLQQVSRGERLVRPLDAGEAVNTWCTQARILYCYNIAISQVAATSTKMRLEAEYPQL